jgi:nucleotide-binding universal stress UspA family protein
MRLLLCTIGSRTRKQTLRFGIEIARALAGHVTLLGVVDKKRGVADLGTFLNQQAAEIAAEGTSVDVRTEHGDAEALVMAELERAAYDLVALGALGTKRSRGLFFDTVAMRIIDRAETSVLVIKGDRQSISKVLICASGTEMGRLSIWAGAAVACGAGAEATVLHVVDPMPSMYAGLEQMEETLAELLQSDTQAAAELRWAAQVVKAECDVSEVKLRRGIVPDEIYREVDAIDYDLVVVGSSEVSGGLRRALMGNVARGIVSRVQRPVLVVRPME